MTSLLSGWAVNSNHSLTYSLKPKFRVAPVALVLSSASSSSCRVCRAVLFDKLDTAKMHGVDTQNVSSRVVSRRDEPSGIWASLTLYTDDDGGLLERTDKVFIAGGFNGQECLNTAECFDPKTRQWTMIAPMRNRRSGIGVIAHDGFVYSVGGFNGITRMNNGEKYNPMTNSWSNITEMYSPRSNFGIEVIRVVVVERHSRITLIYSVNLFSELLDVRARRLEISGYITNEIDCLISFVCSD